MKHFSSLIAGAFVLFSVAAVFAQEPARKVRLSFLPPPLEGTISLGIYDASSKLVRVLHREASLDEFTAGPDALTTRWDGKDDSGNDLAAGKYSARGFIVAPMKIEQVEPSNAAPADASQKISIKLVSNPLAPRGKPSVELVADFDEDASFIRTADGLPLFTVDESPYLFAASLSQRADKSLDLFQNDGDSVDQFHITGIEKMMAFDCGDFELK